MRNEGRKPSKEGNTRPDPVPEGGNGGEDSSEEMESRNERGNAPKSLVDEASGGREKQDGVPKPIDAGESGQALALVLKELQHLKDEFQRIKKKDDKCATSEKKKERKDSKRPAKSSGNIAATNGAGQEFKRSKHESRSPLMDLELRDCESDFCGFVPQRSDDYVSEEGEINEFEPVESVLKQTAKLYGPTEKTSDDLDGHIAEMVNYLFSHGMKEEDWKVITGDEITSRPSNCTELAPVECNPQIFEALKHEGKMLDNKLKSVGHDLTRAGTIMIKSLAVLDKKAQDNNDGMLANHVDMLNGALALVGNANYRNNIARRLVIKREINPKYEHLCSDKVPMTRQLFGDDVSTSAKQIEEADKLKFKIQPQRPFTAGRPGFGRFGPRTSYYGRGYGRGGNDVYGSRFNQFNQYGRRNDYESDNRQYRNEEPKNSRGRGQAPRQ